MVLRRWPPDVKERARSTMADRKFLPYNVRDHTSMGKYQIQPRTVIKVPIPLIMYPVCVYCHIWPDAAWLECITWRIGRCDLTPPHRRSRLLHAALHAHRQQTRTHTHTQ